MHSRTLTAIGFAMAAALPPTAAWAGPCSDEIASLRRALADDPAMGAPVTGSISGTAARGASGSTEAMTSGAPSTSAGGRTSGEGGLKEMNAASAQIATSPEDVRRQQQGLPTAAQDPARASQPADSSSAARNKLAEAAALDSRGDAGCKAALGEARRLSGR